MREVDCRQARSAANVPKRVVLAVSFDEANNRSNIIALGWHMWTSGDPPMAGISVGNRRYSHELLSAGGEFVLAFPGGNIAEEVLFCGTNSGRETDKFKESGLTPVEAKFVKPHLIKECPVNFECRVRGTLRTGDHTVFAGEIAASYLSGGEKLLLLAGTEEGYDIILEKNGYRFGVVKG